MTNAARAPLLLLSTALACATSPGPGPGATAPAAPAPGARVLARGGELDAAAPLAATARVDGDSLVVLGITEVPATSRLQAAQAMADAVARSELMKLVETSVASLAHDYENDAGEVQVSLATAELAKGLLPGLPSPRRGWVKLERGGDTVLRVVAAVRISRAALQRAVAAAPSLRGDTARAAAVADRIFAAPQTSAP